MKQTIGKGVIVPILAFIYHVQGAPNVKDDTITQGEAEILTSCNTSMTYPNLSTYEFNPFNVVFDDTACLSQRMFAEMGFVKLFHIPLENLDRFIKQTQEGYRNVSYHNWGHGFSVLHFSFAVLKNCKDTECDRITPLEGLALLTAAMCHDLDHPGTSSDYQDKICSDMAQKYRNDGSILERHHIEKTLDILRKPEANFVAQLSEEDQSQFKNLIKQIILATDLKTHFKVLSEEQQMAEGFDGTNERHRELLRSVVISSADLSQLTWDWKTTRKAAKSVKTEFFDQGDKEKEMGFQPLKMMDRSKTKIAESQIKFITNVGMPLYRVLARMYFAAQVCIDKLESNLKYWQAAIPYFEEQSKRNRGQLEILDDVELDQITITAGKE